MAPLDSNTKKRERYKPQIINKINIPAFHLLKRRIMNTFMNLLTQVITFGHPNTFRDMDAKKDSVRKVAAGDPALPIRNSMNSYQISETFLVNGKEMKGNDFTEYLVTGNSMYPQGIHNGDYLLVKKSEKDKFKENDFLIIKVDKAYCKKYRQKNTLYDYKLRKALLRVTPKMNDKEIIDRLKDSHYEINLEENQKYMKKKYEEARKAYPDDDLMFSITYHDGKLCYSFHPTRLIEGRASVLVRIKDGKESYKLL